MRDYSKDFAEWRKWRDEKGLPPIYDNPADAGIETDFRVGQQVSFTNEYGVRFEPHVIMGFCKPELRAGASTSTTTATGSRRNSNR